jgi:membrane associated rhomboid family serine protease
MNGQITLIKEELWRRAALIGMIMVSVWAIEVVDLLLWHVSLDQYGIQPRTLIGLRNILFAPLLHHGFGHLIANTIPFLVLGWLVLLRGIEQFWIVTLSAMLVSGLAIWLLGGSQTIHLGLSSVIFGYLGYLICRGYWERSPFAIGLAVLAVLLYGSMLWGLVLWQPGVSWLGHTFGFLGGVWAAYRFILR